MADVLAIVNWELDGPLTGDTSSWRTRYSPEALAFLTGFDEGAWNGSRGRFTAGPLAQPSIQYRDADTGDLVAVHPFSETPNYAFGGPDETDVDIAYGPNMAPDGVIYLGGWNSGATWKLHVDGTEEWRKNGDGGDLIENTFGPWMLPSPDGSTVWAQQLGNVPPNRSIMELDATDGSVIQYVVMGAPAQFWYVSGMVWAPDGGILFAAQGDSLSNRGIYHLDLTTGAVTAFRLLNTLGFTVKPSGTGANYLYAYDMAAHPSGDGFVVAIQNYNDIPTTGQYHSYLVEMDWAGNVTNTYDYSASPHDGQRLAMMFDVAYSNDGNYLYAVGDTSWPVIWRFERGPGNVGGDDFWMQCDYATRAEWLADGSPHYGTAGALWGSTISGIGVVLPSEECPPPANDDFANAEVLVGDSGSIVGDNTCATMEVDEPPAYPSGSAGYSIWYTWTATSGGTLSYIAQGGTGGTHPFDSRLSIQLGIFTGPTLAGLVSAGPWSTTVVPGGPLYPTWAGETYNSILVEEGDTFYFRVHSTNLDEFGPITFAWEFVPTPVSRNIMPTKPGRGRLGCGVNEAYVTWKCGTPRFCSVNATEITWNRSLNDISEAEVVIPLSGNADDTCCECLGDIEPWCHELHIARDGQDVWLGPITEVVYEFDKVTIRAMDLLGWLTVRIAEVEISNATMGGSLAIDMTTFGREILLVAFAEDDPCAIDYISALPSGITGERLFLPYVDTAFDQLDALSQTGAPEYTVVGRTIILMGPQTPTTPIATLMDEHILGAVQLTKSGLLQANRWFVHYDEDDTDIPPGPGVASAPDQYCYGLIERMKDGNGLPNKESAEQSAQVLLDATPHATMARLLEIPDGSQLSPEAPWPISAMIPGVRCDVGIVRLCVDATVSFRLTGMAVRQDVNGEQVTLDLGPLNPLAGEL